MQRTFEQRIFHRVRDRVTSRDCELSINANLDIDQVTESAFANATFVEREHSRNSQREAAHFLLERFRYRFVHDVAQSPASHHDAVCRNERAREQSRPIIGCFISTTSDNRDRDTDERRR